MRIGMAARVSALALLALGGAAIAQGNGAARATPKEAQVHIDRAMALAGKTYMRTTASLQCGLSGPAMSRFANAAVPEPTQLFDNFYYVGVSSVGAYAIKTREGIILIDALNTSEDGVNVIEAGLKKFGLNPADVKYIVVTHGHGDHFGAAGYFAQKYGTHVMMSAADWDLVAKPPMRPAGAPPARFSPPPARDLDARDGMVLSLGGQDIRIVETPGHTPGTISLLVPVTVHGQKHLLAMWGGTGVPRDLEMRAKYIASSERFAAISEKAGADIELSNHPFVDDSLTRMDDLRAHPRGANPFVIGRGAYAKYAGIITECAKAVAEGGPTAN